MFQFFLDTASTTNQGSPWVMIIMIALVIVFFYFFLIRPQKKQEKEAANMRNSLEVGDEITTIGGIIGQIVSIKGETITIVTSKAKTKIRFLKSAVRSVDVKANAPAEEPADLPEETTEEPKSND